MSAEIHAKIAESVYPDAFHIDGGLEHCLIYHSKKDFLTHYSKKINLLETDSNGNPTQQAKASAQDTLVYLVKRLDRHGIAQVIDEMIAADNPCAAIYNAAKEVIGD